MISAEALKTFKQIWVNEFGEEISDEVAAEMAVSVLAMFDAIYRPIKQEWIGKNVIENQPISTSCKSGAAK